MAFSAAGMLAGQSQVQAGRFATLSFFIALALSTVYPLIGPLLEAFAFIEGLLSPGTGLVAGILVASGMHAPIWLIATVTVALGTVHGIANGLSITTSPQVAVSLLGAIIAACIVYGGGLLVAVVLRGPRGRVSVRVLGSWIAALSLMLIGLAVRG